MVLIIEIDANKGAIGPAAITGLKATLGCYGTVQYVFVFNSLAQMAQHHLMCRFKQGHFGGIYPPGPNWVAPGCA
jgi:hypothetical protein